MVWVRKNAAGEIVEVAEKRDWVLQEGETDLDFPNITFDEYLGRLSITANGEQDNYQATLGEIVTVDVTSNFIQAGVIQISVNGIVVDVSMIDGAGSFEVDSSIPVIFHIEPVDQTLFTKSGFGSMEVIYEE